MHVTVPVWVLFIALAVLTAVVIALLADRG